MVSFRKVDEAAISPPDFLDYRASNRTFDCLAAMGYRPGLSNLLGDKPEQVLTTIASANFFGCLGVRPLLGRDFLSADEQVNMPQVAILGYGSGSAISGLIAPLLDGPSGWMAKA